jgi:hypothetical protein
LGVDCPRPYQSHLGSVKYSVRLIEDVLELIYSQPSISVQDLCTVLKFLSAFLGFLHTYRITVHRRAHLSKMR